MRCTGVFARSLAMVAMGSLVALGIGAALAPTRVPDFKSLDRGAASAAADAIARERWDSERALAQQLEDATVPADRKVLVIYVLGCMRSRWAVPVLVRMVDFKAPFSDPATDVPRWGPYPSVDALTLIGDQSLGMILDELGKGVSDARARLLVEVVFQVDRAKVGHARLQAAIDAAPKETERKNLEHARDLFDKLAEMMK